MKKEPPVLGQTRIFLTLPFVFVTLCAMVDGATLCNDVDLHDVFPFILFFFLQHKGFWDTFEVLTAGTFSVRHCASSKYSTVHWPRLYESTWQVFTDNNCQKSWAVRALCTQGGHRVQFRIPIDGKSTVKFGLIHYLNHIQQNGPHEMKCK